MAGNSSVSTMTDRSKREMTTDIPEDPVEMVMRAIEHYDGLRSRIDPLKDIMDRERLLVAIIIGMLSDPNHPVGKHLGRDLLAAWIERGGKVPRPYYLSRGLLEPSQFDFTVQYLHDYGMKTTEIANALGVDRQTVYSRVRYMKHEEEPENE